MINAVNNISFKSILIPKYPKLSDSQERVLEDIKTKLGDKKEKSNFLVKPLDNDVLELSQVYNVKTVGTGIDKKVRYSDPLFIGRYNEENPFELKDLQNVHKHQLKLLGETLAIFSVFIMPVIIGLISMNYAVNSRKSVTPQQTEKVVTMSKDSLQTLKDSILNVSKDSLKMFK